MDIKIIWIAWWSWTWKSTLTNTLREKYSDILEVVHFDDYQKNIEEVPLLWNLKNWDHPDCINFHKLYEDLSNLKKGFEIEVMTKDRYINPKYEENGRKKHKILPKKVIIVEGYMSFYDKNIRDLYDFKIYLNLPIQESIKRRDKSTCSDDDLYNQIILIPMHEKYVEPTKIYANLQVDVLKNKQNNVYIQVEEQMKKLNIL